MVLVSSHTADGKFLGVIDLIFCFEVLLNSRLAGMVVEIRWLLSVDVGEELMTRLKLPSH